MQRVFLFLTILLSTLLGLAPFSSSWGQFSNLGLGGQSFSLLGANGASSATAYNALTNPAAANYEQSGILEFGLRYYPHSIKKALNSNPPISNSGITTVFKDPSEQKAPSWLHLGGSFSLAKFINIGVTATLPTGSLAKIYSSTSHETNYLLFNSQLQRPEIATSLALNFFEHLSFGGSFLYSFKAHGEIQAGISKANAESRAYLELRPVIIPQFGFFYTSKKFGEEDSSDFSWNIGGSYRFADKQPVTVNFDIKTEGGIIPLQGLSDFIPYYSPAQANLGATFFYLKNQQTSIQWDLTWWSQYVPPTITLSGDTLVKLDRTSTLRPPLDLKDTHTLRIGHTFNNLTQVAGFFLSPHLGFGYQTSAVTSSPPSLMILDTEKILLGLGATFKRDRLGDFIKTPFWFSLGGQYIKLNSKTLRATAPASQAPIQELEVGGHIWGLSPIQS